jgi:hypothetical protein
MNVYKIRRYAGGSLTGPILAALLMLLPKARGVMEEKFDVLQIGTQTYSNVTVTTKAKNYVFLLHSAGMASIKVSQLPPDLLEKLGYATAKTPQPATNTVVLWAKKEIARINPPQVKDLSRQLEQKWRERASAKLAAMHLTVLTLVTALLGVGLLLYLFYCYCCMLICRKAGGSPGILVWLPVVQVLPLLRAAGMSSWWFLACCVPGLNIVVQVLWCFRIAKARGKNVWVAVLLLLPVTNIFAFLCLAFSNSTPSGENQEAEPKLMSLQTA